MKGYRTIIFNIVMTISMGLALWMPEAETPDAETVNTALDNVEAAITAVWGIGNMILRAITNTPMFNKE